MIELLSPKRILQNVKDSRRCNLSVRAKGGILHSSHSFGMTATLVTVFLLLIRIAAYSAENPKLEDQTREIATELRCVVCQNLSVAD